MESRGGGLTVVASATAAATHGLLEGHGRVQRIVEAIGSGVFLEGAHTDSERLNEGETKMTSMEAQTLEGLQE